MSIPPDPQDAAAASLPGARPVGGQRDLPDGQFLEAVAAGLSARRSAEVGELELVAGWVLRLALVSSISARNTSGSFLRLG